MPALKKLKLSWQSVETIVTILAYLKRQKKYIRKNIVPFLDEAMAVNDGSIDLEDIKKITGYYGLAVPAVIGEAICVLRHKKMTATERKVSTCQGAMTGLGDDFFDKQRLSETELKNFIEGPDINSGKTELEKIALHFYISALNNSARPLLMKNQVIKVFQSQLLSKKQTKPGLSILKIQEITFQKGGQSLLFYRTAFAHPLKKGEDDVLFVLGSLMQLSNDIFDVYKDLQNGIHTLVTTTSNIHDLRKIYDETLHTGIQATLQLEYNKNDIRKFLRILSMAIFSRCYVCMDQLESNEKNSDNIFRPHQYTRKELVCDMDNWNNKIKSIKYHMWITQKFT
jgi:hypothetical protein